MSYKQTLDRLITAIAVVFMFGTIIYDIATRQYFLLAFIPLGFIMGWVMSKAGL